MKRRILFFYCLILILNISHAQISIDTQYVGVVKSIRLAPEDDKLAPPILTLGYSTRLLVEFDMLVDEPETYQYTIVHCDRTFHPDDLSPQEYIYGFHQGYIEDHQFSMTTLQPYIHYSQTLPMDNSEITASGNYLLIVHQTDQPDSILFVRRFRVTEQLFDIEMTFATPSEAPKENQEIEVAIEAKAETDRQWTNPYHLHPILQQNGRTDLCRELPFSSYQGNKLWYRYKPENIFPGGNCYRYFDFSNIRTPMYNVQSIERFGGETFVMLRPCENLSRKNYNYTEGLMGGYKIHVWDRTHDDTEADYAWVNISLPMEHPWMDGTVHVVGELTQWNLGDTSRMEWNPRFKAYVKRMYLKQGYYSYQLLFKPIGKAEGETAPIEGNHYETPNEYALYLYGRRPSDRYDRLIGYKKSER